MEIGWRQMLQQEQKIVPLMKYGLWCNLSRPNNQVVGLFVGACSTSKSCLLLGQRRRFLGFEKGSGFAEISKASFVKVYTFQLLYEKFDLKGSVGKTGNGNGH